MSTSYSYLRRWDLSPSFFLLHVFLRKWDSPKYWRSHFQKSCLEQDDPNSAEGKTVLAPPFQVLMHTHILLLKHLAYEFFLLCHHKRTHWRNLLELSLSCYMDGEAKCQLGEFVFTLQEQSELQRGASPSLWSSAHRQHQSLYSNANVQSFHPTQNTSKR